MEILVSIFAFLRPVFFVDLPISIAGLSILQLVAIGLMAVLGLSLMGHMTLRRRVSLTQLDTTILLYSFWCIGGWLAYPDKTVPSELAKWIFPLLGYVILKNIIVRKQHYQLVLFAMLLGYTVPVIASAVMIIFGQGVYEINYWTKIARYSGVFANPHNFGHAMAFYVMSLVIFLHLRLKDDVPKTKQINKPWVIVLLLLLPVVLFCLYKSYVRTAYLGVVLFFLLYLYQVNRRWLIVLTFVGGIGVVVLLPVFALIFLDVVEVLEGEKGIQMLGSGRPFFWKHNIQEFFSLPFQRQLIGGGIGNDIQMYTRAAGDSFWDSHNDYLDVLVETGIVGFVLFVLIQAMLWIQIIRLDSSVRPPFIALMCSVTLMNLVSNSYVSRFGVAQLLYLVLVYTELRPSRVAIGATAGTITESGFQARRGTEASAERGDA